MKPRISNRYGCGVYVVSLQDYRDYGSYSSIRNFSEEFYNHYRLGLGQNRNGILLVLSMAERDYCLIAYGSDAHYAFTDYGKDLPRDTANTLKMSHLNYLMK